LLDHQVSKTHFQEQPHYGLGFGLYGFSCDIDNGVMHVPFGESFSFTFKCDQDKLQLNTRYKNVIVREAKSGLIIPDAIALCMDGISNCVHIHVVLPFPSQFVVEVYLSDTTGEVKHLISVKLISSQSMISRAVPLHHILYSNHSTLSHVQMSRIRPSKTGKYIVKIHSKSSLKLKVGFHQVIGKQLIYAAGMRVGCCKGGKLMMSVSESGIYKISIYKESSDKSYLRLYTVVAFLSSTL
jgi:hypothetical protein